MPSRPPTYHTADVLRRRSLHEDVAEWLRARIAEDRFPPGSIIPELEVCAELGVSRTPVREALKALAIEELVEIVPARGARVVALGADDIRAMVVVLARLEALAAELACARIDEDSLLALASLHERMVRHHAAGRRSDYFRLNLQFHEAILRAAANRHLHATWESYSGRLRRIRFLANMKPAEWRKSLADHAEIVAMLRRRDAAALGRLMEVHVGNIWPTLVQAAEASAGALDQPARMPVARTAGIQVARSRA
jgi:DNA-binding GntR family transcriptional regulator